MASPKNLRRPSLLFQFRGSILFCLFAVAFSSSAFSQLAASIEGAFSFSSILITLFLSSISALIGFWIISLQFKVVEQRLQSIREFLSNIGKLKPTLVPTIPMNEDTAGLMRATRRLFDRVTKSLSSKNKELSELFAILESMREGILLIDKRERVLRMNRAALTLLDVNDYQKEKLIQETVRIAALLRFIKRALNSQEPLTEIISVDIRTQGKDGEDRQYQLSSVPIHEKDGITGVLLIVLDVTDLRRLESLRKDFVSNVSHELRTPLTSIQGYLETLASGTVTEEADRTRFVDTMLRQSKRLNSIFNDLLALSRIERQEESGDIHYSLENLPEFVHATVASCQDTAADAHVQLITETIPDVSVLCNFGLLQQALANLLENAIKYASRGEKVIISVTEEAATISIHVTDFGEGIAAEHLPRIFERFYRVDRGRSRKDGGTGLGLAIVKHIMKVHGGKVSVKSHEGKGSCFTLELPHTTPTQSRDK